jgi:hypothetical protein
MKASNKSPVAVNGRHCCHRGRGNFGRGIVKLRLRGGRLVALETLKLPIVFVASGVTDVAVSCDAAVASSLSLSLLAIIPRFLFSIYQPYLKCTLQNVTF